MNIHVHDVIALGLPQLEVGQVFLGSYFLCSRFLFPILSIILPRIPSLQDLITVELWLKHRFHACIYISVNLNSRGSHLKPSLIEGVEAGFPSLGIPSTR